MRKIDFGLILLLLAIHFYFGLSSIKKFSPTYDEPVHLTAGYVYLVTGDYRYNGYHHPPFGEMWAALPLLFLKPEIPKGHPAWIIQRWRALEQYQFADFFLYSNSVDHEKLMNAGRIMQILLSFFLGIYLFFIGLKISGRIAGLIAMTIWCLSPTIIAHSTVVSTDLSFAFFYFGFFSSLLFWGKWWGNLLSGIFLGLCIGSKYLSIAIGPGLFVVLCWLFYKHPEVRKEIFSRKTWGRISIIGGSALVVLLVVYRFTEISVFFEGFRRIIGRSQMGRSSFFLGEHGTQGWLSYFPFLLLVKTSIVLLISGFIAFIFSMKKKIALSALLVIPPVTFFLITCFSKVQIGHRHILAIYPFLIFAAAIALKCFKNKGIVGAFVVSMFVETSLARPHFLSFFNSLIGGSQNGYKYVTDSNVDWGQGLKELSEVLSDKDKEKGIFLSYFGVAKPAAYGIKFINVGSDEITGRSDNRTELGMRPTKFAISLSNYQATYYAQKDVFKWLQEKKPMKRVGHSMFIYDFEKDAESLRRLAVISGWWPKG